MASPLANRSTRPRDLAVAAFGGLWTVVVLVLLTRFAELPYLTALVGRTFRGPYVQLQIRALWAALHVLGLALIPLLFARGARISWSSLGLSLPVLRTEWTRLLWMVCGSLPVIFALSFLPGFQRGYPMFRSSEMGVLVTLAWLFIYALYLSSIELYFRGILLALWSPVIGAWSVVAAMIPYVLTHRFGPEIIGAVPVGILLGIWRLRCGSIVPGLLAHFLIATEIELCALWQVQHLERFLFR